MAVSETFTDKKRAMALELYEEGFGCNAIARKVEMSPAFISKWAKAEGLPFDRKQTDLAVRAHTLELAEARTLLAQKMAVVASDLLDMTDKPFTVFNFGGKDNTFNQHELDAPPVDAQRTIMTAAAIAFDKATKVVDEQANPGELGTKAMLTKLGEHLGVS